MTDPEDEAQETREHTTSPPKSRTAPGQQALNGKVYDHPSVVSVSRSWTSAKLTALRQPPQPNAGLAAEHRRDSTCQARRCRPHVHANSHGTTDRGSPQMWTLRMCKWGRRGGPIERISFRPRPCPQPHRKRREWHELSVIASGRGESDQKSVWNVHDGHVWAQETTW